MNTYLGNLQPFFTIATYTALEGVKTRLLWLVVGTALAGVMLASFAGTLSVTETVEIQRGILSAFLRFSGVLIICLFVLNSQVREFNDKGLELVLALPVTRTVFFFGKLAGYALTALPITLIFLATLAFYARIDQTLLWGVSLFFEQLIIIGLSLLCLFTFSQVPAAFSMVLAIYLLGRTLSSLQLVGHGPIMPHYTTQMVFMNAMIDAIAYILPSLDRFTRSDWLMYNSGGWADLAYVMGQGFIYLLLLSAVALIDLHRKNF